MNKLCDFIDDNSLALIIVAVIACWSLRVGHAEIANTVAGGILGWMAKSVQGK